jgi:glycine/D-amino acid oxidase-like deaminating enzyme
MLVWDRPVSPDFDATLAAFQEAGLDHALLSPADVKARFPLLSLPAESRVCWMPDAGFLDADLCVAALIERAQTGGAEIVFHQQVARIDLSGTRPLVHTATTAYRCDGLIVTPGPWAGTLLQECGWPLTVTRQNVFHVRPRDPERYGPASIPVLGDRISGEYSFPVYDSTIKVAQSAIGPTTDPEARQPEPSQGEGDRLAAWLGQVLPGMVAEPLGGVPCFYTLTPDRGFIVTRHPHHGRVVVGAGFSGHGFKFAPEIARILVDLLCDERDGPDFLAPARFGVGAAPPLVV